MPIYEYICRDCGHTFQLLQRVGAGSEGVACPQCSSHEVERLLKHKEGMDTWMRKVQ